METIGDVLEHISDKYLELKRNPLKVERRQAVRSSKVKKKAEKARAAQSAPVAMSASSAAAPRAAAAQRAKPAMAIAERLKSSILVPVYHATNRNKIDSKRFNHDFDDQMEDNLSYGRTDVSIPLSHKRGTLERPGWFSGENESDHVMIQNIVDMKETMFFRKLGEEISQSGRKSTFVFLHGFNVKFDDAARRAAQISYDLFRVGIENKTAVLDTVPILFSWPSYGKVSKYVADQNNAENSVLQFARFLIDIRDRTKAESINIIAHSMGNRILVRALRELKLRFADVCPFLDQVVMAAPDVNRRYFKDRAKDILSTSKRFTLYASDRDLALDASKRVNGQRRVGDAEEGIFTFKGMDSVDASSAGEDFLAHASFGETPVLNDMYQIMASNKAPSKRTGITRHKSGGYWILG